MAGKWMMASVAAGLMLGVSAGNSFAFNVGSQEIDVTLTQSYVTRYIWRGQDLYPNNDGAFQPSVDVAFKKLLWGADISFNAWGSMPDQNGHELSREVDYSTTASRDFKDCNLSAGYLYYDYYKANRYADSQEYWGSFKLFQVPMLPPGVALTLLTAYDAMAAKGGPRNGWYFSWGLSDDIALPKCHLTQMDQKLSLSFANWGNTGVAALKRSNFYATELNVTTSYTLDKITVSPGIHYVLNYEKDINNENEFWAGLNLSYAF